MYFPFHFELLSSFCLDAQRFFTLSLTSSHAARVSFHVTFSGLFLSSSAPSVEAACCPRAAVLCVCSAARFPPGAHSTRILDFLCPSAASSIIDTSFHLFLFFFSNFTCILCSASLVIYSLSVAQSLRDCARTYLRGGEWGFLSAAACGLLAALASLAVEHGLQGTRPAAVAAHRLRSRGARPSLL